LTTLEYPATTVDKTVLGQDDSHSRREEQKQARGRERGECDQHAGNQEETNRNLSQRQQRRHDVFEF
jgi:hypothetical protein